MTVTPISTPSNTAADDILDAETNAGRLHALIMGLICTDDTAQPPAEGGLIVAIGQSEA